MIYGYARVSTQGPSYGAHLLQLEDAGCAKVFAETASGARSDRAELAKLMKILAPSDVLMETRLDRLSRSTRDLLNIVAQLAKRGAAFRSLSDAWADTTTPHGRLMLTVLGVLAEFEREIIRARTTDGRVRAKARGQSLGRRPKLTPHQQSEVRACKAAGEAVRKIARSYNVSAATISRI